MYRGGRIENKIKQVGKRSLDITLTFPCLPANEKFLNEKVDCEGNSPTTFSQNTIIIEGENLFLSISFKLVG